MSKTVNNVDRTVALKYVHENMGTILIKAATTKYAHSKPTQFVPLSSIPDYSSIHTYFGLSCFLSLVGNEGSVKCITADEEVLIERSNEKTGNQAHD